MSFKLNELIVAFRTLLLVTIQTSLICYSAMVLAGMVCSSRPLLEGLLVSWLFTTISFKRLI
jgi:hypothetical protein